MAPRRRFIKRHNKRHYQAAEEICPGTPSAASDSSEDQGDSGVPKSGKFRLLKLDGEEHTYTFDGRQSIGWIVSLVLTSDVFDRGERPRAGRLVYKDRTFSERDFYRKIWRVVDGTGYDDPPPAFTWVFDGEMGADPPASSASSQHR